MTTAGGGAPSATGATIERLVAEAATSARALGLAVDAAALAPFVAARLDEDGAPPSAPPADLALACAVVAGDAAAIAAFERLVIAPLATLLGRRYAAEVIAEVQQRLRIQLLVTKSGDGGGRGLGSYRGRGPLGAWVRVLAVREAERARRALAGDGGRGAEELDDEVVAALDRALLDPERQLARATMAEALHAALRTASEALAPRQRTLLRYAYVDHLSIDRIAPLFAVHRATAARWLEQARADLLRGTQKALAARLALPVDALQSLLRSVDSQLHVSLARLFATSPR